jgi:hypothetical protein
MKGAINRVPTRIVLEIGELAREWARERIWETLFFPKSNHNSLPAKATVPPRALKSCLNLGGET